MKTNQTVVTFALAAVLAWAAGCGKKDTTVEQDLQKAGSEAGEAIATAAEAVKESGAKLAQDAKAAGQQVAANVSTKAQEILDATKKYISEGKIQEALAKWKELAGEKLTTEQQAMADSLKAQIDKLTTATSKTADEAAKAAGNLLK